MTIKVHIALVLAICTITSFLMGLGLVVGYERVETQAQQIGPDSAARRDVGRLESRLQEWLFTIDLVLKGESHMIDTSIRHHSNLRDVLDQIRDSRLAAGRNGALLEIEEDALQLQSLVREARDLRGPQRRQRLGEFLLEADHISRPMIARIGALKKNMIARSRFLLDDLEEQRGFLRMLSFAAAALYLMVAGLSWFWTVRSTVRPIENLSLATEQAHIDDSFALQEQGPDEVCRLTRNISTFVTMLQTAKERTEEEVRQRTEQLVKANSAKSEFLATMSHELRTPLNGIINMNELMLATDLDQEQIEFARTAKNASEALFALINDILDFSKIEARKLELDHQEFNVRDVVDGAVEIMTGVAEAKGIELGCIVSRDVPVQVVNDSMRVRQILINLLNNALKFTEAGSVVARVSMTGQQLLRVTVTDTGIGIPPDRAASLFRPFEQVDASTTRKYGGTGLGLAISKELAELMGGEIGVDSEVGVGSTFWFTIHAELGEHAWDGRLAEEHRDRGVLLLGDRALVEERLREQLVCLGLGDAQVHSASVDDDGIASIQTLVDEDSGRLAIILDPDLAERSTWARLGRIRTDHSGLQVCVLKDVLRNDSADGTAPPEGVEWLPSPTKMLALQQWLSGVCDYPKQGQTSPEDVGTPATDRQFSILVAEDNLINQRIAQKVLEGAGYEVTLVGDGEKAVAKISERSFDVILMDCQMPILDGWAATEEIRMRESNGELAAGCPTPLPIVALTANALASDREKCLAAGMSDYLAKPFRPKELVETVQKSLPKRDTTA